jgi:transposase-like protein
MGEDFPRTEMDLERRFSTERACAAYLIGLRWPQGWSCPRCDANRASMVRRERWRCRGCGYEMSIRCGTIFQDSHLPLTTWMRAMWHIVSQKNGMSALGLQRVLGLGSYKTAWAMHHKLRRAMVRTGRDRLGGESEVVEVDESYWGGEEKGVVGRQTETKAIVIVAAELDGNGMGRIRMQRIADLTKDTLHAFISKSIKPGSMVRTDGLNAYMGLNDYQHDRQIQRDQAPGEHLLPHVHRVLSLFKRWVLGTHQGAIAQDHLDDYLNEFTFRFNRRKSASRGKLFYRLAQQAVQTAPTPFAMLVTKPPSAGGRGVK